MPFIGGGGGSSSPPDNNTIIINGSGLLQVVTDAPLTNTSGVGIAGVYYNSVYAQSTITGEAPTLSSTYAQYDTGVHVFKFYDNFIGVAINASNWTTDPTVSVNNSITISGQPDRGDLIAVNAIGELDVTDCLVQSGLGTENFVMSYNGSANTPAGGSLFIASRYSSPTVTYTIEIFGGGTLGTLGTSTEAALVILSMWQDATKGYGQLNYGTIHSGTFTELPTPYLSAQNSQDASAHPFVLQWVRTRLPPPSFVMPTLAVGALITTPTATKYGYAYGLPLVLSNTQSAGTPANMQQLISTSMASYANLCNYDCSNIFFTSDSAGATELASWRESGAPTGTVEWWVNLAANTIAATVGTLTIYLWFL